MKSKTISLPVTGMTCANCATTIERNLRKLEGIDQAQVNLANERVTLEYHPELLGTASIVKRVKDIGYGIATVNSVLPIHRNDLCQLCNDYRARLNQTRRGRPANVIWLRRRPQSTILPARHRPGGI